MTTYTLYFSDKSKTATISVLGADVGPGVNNYDTSLDLIGSGYQNYGYASAQNSLKLLENFASPNSPQNAIEGQLWYDTSNPNKKVLRINNGTLTGTRWQAVSGVYQQPADPSKEYSSVVYEGDIWVDTSLGQLKIRTGVDWVTVGPNATSGLDKTGSEAAFLESSTGTTYPVILNWSDGKVVEIISYNSFTPRLVIDGFFDIKAGTNLTSKVATKYNGVADSALALKTSTGEIVTASKILKNEAATQVLNGQLTIEGSGGLYVKNSSVDRYIRLYNNPSGGFINFSNTASTFTLGIGTNSYIKFNGSSKNIGINTSTTTSSPTLDVYGSFRATNTATITDSSNSNSTSTGALIVAGGAGIKKDVWIGGSLNVAGNSVIRGRLTLGEIGSGGISIIEPATSDTYDIGSETKPFKRIFASSIGTTGTESVKIFGTVFGSATRLESARTFSLTGQVTTTSVVSFNGTANVALTTIVTRDVIAAQSSTGVTTSTQNLLVVDLSTSTTSLQKISKNTFLSDVYPSLFITGMVTAFTTSTAPSGFLLCNGSSVSIATQPSLFSVFGYTYGGAGPNFNLPNLTGVTTALNGPIYYIVKT
jgi:hypothetical protein